MPSDSEVHVLGWAVGRGIRYLASWGAAGPNLPSCLRDDIAQRRRLGLALAHLSDVVNQTDRLFIPPPPYWAFCSVKNLLPS